MSFIAELNRRNVIRMAGLYLVGAWLVVQIGETLLPIFHTPDWVLQALVVVLALGFVPALVFSWVFELTPEGVRRDSGGDAPDAIGLRTAKRLDYLILIGLFGVVAVVAADRFWPRESVPSGRTGAAQEAAQTAPAAEDPQGASPAGDDAGQTSAAGIAVLPFDNLSPDPDNAYFAGGVYEEVLTKLARIAELRVISRTSMERIAEEKLDVRSIGGRLGVSHVLEGSVRRAGNQVRVTVQLIEVATDAHVWAENYDRDLDDVFAIQSEIALAIADQLKISLSPQLQANLSEAPTRNQTAYELYLRALDEGSARPGAPGYLAIIDLLEPAVELDAGFADAKVRLADAYGRMFWLRADPDGVFLQQARDLVSDLEQRWPQRAETRLARAQLSYNVEQDYARALQQFLALQPSLPNHPERLKLVAACLKRLNRHEEFLAAARVALGSDPESAALQVEMMQALVHTRRYAEALQFGQQAQAKFPRDPFIDAQMAEARLLQQQDVDAVIDYGRRAEAQGITLGLPSVIVARFIRGDVDGALRLLERQEWETPRAAAWGAARRAELLQLAGRVDEARTLAEDAHAVARSTTDSGAPRVDQGVAFWFASAAQMAGVAGARDDALRWQARALAAPMASIDERWQVALSLAAAQRGLGDAEGAWAMIAPFAGDGRLLPDAELRAFRAWYERLYGASPSYQAYMRGIGGAP